MYKISLNTKAFTQKPEESEIKKLKFQAVECGLENLMKHISEGKSFVPAVFRNNQRKTKSFESQSIFAVDFDNTLTRKEAEDILTDYGISYSFGYYTFRHQKNAERFRLVFQFDDIICDYQLAKYINHAFFCLFDKKSDKACKDVTRLWLGSRSNCFIGKKEDKINIKSFLNKVNSKVCFYDHNKMRSLVLADDLDICLNSYNSNINNKIILSKTNKSKDSIATTKPKVYNWNLKDLLKVKIFEAFYNGKGTSTKVNKLSHDELLGLATNMIHLKGGGKLYKDCLAKNKHYSRDKESLYNYVKCADYPAMCFADFSEFSEDIKNPHQTFYDVCTKRGKITVSPSNEIYLNVDDAYRKLEEEYNKIIQAQDNNIYLLKCAAGLGKTQLIKNTPGIVAAFPNHDLKEEHFKDSGLKEKLSTPSLKGFSAETQKHFNHLYDKGLNDIVYTLIKDLAKGKNISQSLSINSSDVDYAQQYLSAITGCKVNILNETVFTTHQRALFTDFTQSTIVYDESPINAFLNQGQAEIKDIKSAIAGLGLKKNDVSLLKAAIQAKEGELHETPVRLYTLSTIEKIIKKHDIKTNVIGFLKSKYYIINGEKISYCINFTDRIPVDKKIIIADATASETIYKSLFGHRLKVIDISNVANKGKINQFTYRGCSRSGLDRYHEFISKQLNSDPVVTFKGHMDKFSNAIPEIYFGKQHGSNALTGMNFNLVGTPHYSPNFYKFLSKACNLHIADFTMELRNVTYKNKQFTFSTFSDNDLQLIQFELIEGDLIQAVQRARLIRHNATVTVYSNFPLPQAQYNWHSKGSAS